MRKYIPTTRAQRAVLAAGAGLLSLLDPTRGDMVARFGELSAPLHVLEGMRDKMVNDPTGARILEERPVVTERTSVAKCAEYAPNTLGRCYFEFMDGEGLTAESRSPVKYIEDEELAYVMQRYREVHDFVHVLYGVASVRVADEVALKGVEFLHTKLPMNLLSVLGAVRVPLNDWKDFDGYRQWVEHNGSSKFILNVYYEEELETDIDLLRAEMGIKVLHEKN